MASFPPDALRETRRLITRLIGAGEFPSRVAVTSSVRGEGTTYVSLLLATVLAHDFQRPTCLAELNWVAPCLGEMLAAGSNSTIAQGADIGLGHDAPLEQLVRPTGLPTLFIAPAGDLDASQRAVVPRSAGLRQRLDTLSAQFPYVVFDVPAVHTSPEAVPLACLADAVLVVVRQSATALSLVTSALSELKHANVCGMVLNQVQTATPRRVLELLPQA